MKETINYFYNIYPSKINNLDNGVSFYYRDYKYYFIKYTRDVREIESLVKISNDLYNKNIMVHTFIVSTKGSYYVVIDSQAYILLRVNNFEDDLYSLKDIVKFDNFLVSDRISMDSDWAFLWEKKVDLYEGLMTDLNNDYVLVQASFDYYVGLAENAISYFKNTVLEDDIKQCKITLNHNRISSNVYSGEINNPLSFTFDYEVRDIAEYIKSKFFSGDLDYFEIEELIVRYPFSRCSLRFLFSRLLYPSYYFDALSNIFDDISGEEVLLKFINRSQEYEDFLIDVFNLINRKVNIPPLEWLINKD